MRVSLAAARVGGPLLGSRAAHAVVIAAVAATLGITRASVEDGAQPVVRVLPAVEASVRGDATPIERAPIPEPTIELPPVHEVPMLAPSPPTDSGCWWPEDSVPDDFHSSYRATPPLRIFPMAAPAEMAEVSQPVLIPDLTAPARAPVLVAARLNPATCPAPEYPRLARRRGLEGVVNLLLQVSADGRVTDTRVAASSGHALLDEAALVAARSWRLEPATENGVAVAGALRVPLRFRLER